MVKIIFIGSSHIAKESVTKIRNEILKIKPEIVAVELDEIRLRSLFSKDTNKTTLKNIKEIGFMGFFFTLLGKMLQEKMGKLVGMAPGSDMKAAVLAGKKAKSKIFLIDKNILNISRDISIKLSFFEKIKLVLYILLGLMYTPFAHLFKKPRRGIDLSKVPSKDTITELIYEFKKKFPKLYAILIEDRNKHMASALNFLSKEHPAAKIIVVVGAGHISGIKDILKNKYSIKIEEL